MASDIFAKLGDIKGESLDSKHKDEIEVLSFSWSLTNPDGGGSAAGVGRGRATFQDLTIVHKIDKATPSLLRACATGTHLKDATITHRKAGKGQHEYLIVKMDDIVITGVSHGGSNEVGSESVTLAFAKVQVEYRAQRPDGALEAGDQQVPAAGDAELAVLAFPPAENPDRQQLGARRHTGHAVRPALPDDDAGDARAVRLEPAGAVRALLGLGMRIALDEVDPMSSPMKAKGVGELGISGVGAAVANAIYNATGIRVRDYPITLDKLLDRMPDAA